MKEPLIAVMAVFCNVAAQFAMKYAGRGSQAATGLAMWLSTWLIAAVALYGVSFFLTVRVFAVNPLSVASPSMAGGTFFLVTVMSWAFLGESIGLYKVIGIGLIFLGILALTRG